MPFTVFNLNASACPLPVLPTSLAAPTSGAPPVSAGLVAGQTRDRLLAAFNENGWLGDFGGRSAGGCFGVVAGLDLTSAGGLTVTIAAGWAFVDGMVYRSATTHAVTDGQRNFLWLTQAAAITLRNDASPPPGAACFLGSVLCSGGAIAAIDGSGVMNVNGVPYRRTADAGQPGDTPPANLRLHTETVGGLYLWTGTRYWQIA